MLSGRNRLSIMAANIVIMLVTAIIMTTRNTTISIDIIVIIINTVQLL